MKLDAWSEGYRVAWEQADVAGAAALFTEDATYRSLIFTEPHVGQDGVAAYWESVTSRQSNVVVRMGAPFVHGDRVAVEFWTQMASDGEDVTLAGCLLLRFAPDGRCRELREYWNLVSGRREPPAEWGT